MTEDEKQKPPTLKGEAALNLWRKGLHAWNNWIAQNPDTDISFAGVGFSTERNAGGELSFGGYHFGNGDVDFSGAEFGDGNVYFFRTKFGNGYVNFTRAKFGNGDKSFYKARFGKGDVNFSEATFGDGELDFSHANFGDGDVKFSGVKFGRGNVLFSHTTLGIGGLYFIRTNFSDGLISFSFADYSDNTVSFYEASSGKGELCFSNSILNNCHLDFSSLYMGEGYLNFADADLDNARIIFKRAKLSELSFRPRSFELGRIFAQGLTVKNTTELTLPPSSTVASLNLRSASCNGPLLLSGNLTSVPDLRGTRWSHQVELSELSVKLRRAWHGRGWPPKLSRVAEHPEDAARLRRLKEIAETNKDHQAALRFSADENRARRWVETSWFGSVLDMAFSACSNYGQSILRPFVALVVLGTATMSLYKELASATFTVWWKAWEHATLLSISNTLPFLPQSRDLRKTAQDALYPGDPGFWVDALMIGQGALSFVFLFLIGLGLRNRFRL